MEYIQLTIQATEQQQEELIALLSDYNATGFEQQEQQLTAYFNAADYNEEAVKDILSGYAYMLKKVAEQNWNEIWESNFQPVIVGDFCAIRADFHQPLQKVQHEIIITPKMSFGTGHHATTYMMIQQMQTLDFNGKKVFDFGTGTGILAILAEKLGALDITATDIDEWSIDNAHENIQRNHCSHIHVFQSSSIPNDEFNIILANINKNIILHFLPAIKSATVAKGHILLSGLLAEDEPEVVAAAKQLQLTLQKKVERQNWISLLFANQSV